MKIWFIDAINGSANAVSCKKFKDYSLQEALPISKPLKPFSVTYIQTHQIIPTYDYKGIFKYLKAYDDNDSFERYLSNIYKL